MQLDADKIKFLTISCNSTLKNILSHAGLSKTAYYNLLYKESILPKSIHALAAVLHVPPSNILKDDSQVIEKMRKLAVRVKQIKQKYHKIPLDNIRHTLLLLEQEPLVRLRRSLQRGQSRTIK